MKSFVSAERKTYNKSSRAMRAHYEDFLNVRRAAGPRNQAKHGISRHCTLFAKTREGRVQIRKQLLDVRQNNVNRRHDRRTTPTAFSGNEDGTRGRHK
jgi:hypothetical protein